MNRNQQLNVPRIAVSRLSPNYTGWLHKLYEGIQIIDMGDHDPSDIEHEIRKSSGLLLTGGGDIHPRLYGEADIRGYCSDIDEKRDEQEWKMIEAAFTMHLPILAICRGMQLLNVFRGGTLYTDIPSDVGKDVLHRDQTDVIHSVTIRPGSVLNRITGKIGETVNSSHHQAVKKLAGGMVVTAYSKDCLAEAIEIYDRNLPFCLGIQWHPERMDIENPMSGKLGRAFINYCIGVMSDG